MKRTFLIGFLVSSFCATVAMYGQARAGYGTGGGHAGGPAPVGSVGRAPIVPPFGRPLPVPPGSGYGRGGYGRHNGNGYGYGIAAYPVYVGGFSGDYYPGYTDQYLSAPAAPAAPPPPPVVINQYFSAPQPAGQPEDDSGVQVYSQPSQPASTPPSPEPRSYLIAFKDHSVYSALAYWVEDHTLHYVTTQNTHNQADVSLIDLDFTKKLNQDRNMAFSLTPTQR